MTTTKTSKSQPRVCVTHCTKCRTEVTTGFRELAGPCPTCGASHLANRWIENPHPQTVAKARRNSGQ